MDSALKTGAALSTSAHRAEVACFATQNSKLKTQNLLLPALATGAILFACYFPLNCGWLAWLALVPLLSLVRTDASKKRIFFCAWAGGLVFYWPVLQWLRVADPAMYATWALLATYCALYVPIAILMVRFLDRTTRLPLIVTFPVVWVALEFLRAHLATGFTWYVLGYSQHDFLPAIQVADLGGVYAVSVLVAAVNALLFEVLYARPVFRRFLRLPEPLRLSSRRALLVQAISVVLLLGGSLAYGEWRLHQTDFVTGPKVALVQGDLPLRVKNDAYQDVPGGAAEAMRQHHLGLTGLTLAAHPDLLVWPETSWPDDWVEVLSEDGRQSQPMIYEELNKETGVLRQRIMNEWHTDALIGLNTLIVSRSGFVAERYNSAVLVEHDGSYGGRYDKIHRVPFGEYIPLKDWFPFMEKFSPYDFDYSIASGKHLTRFPLGPYHFGVMICYEDGVDDLARKYALPDGNQAAADFLLNTSNDGWFDDTPEHAQHLAVCRFRAIEARRSVGRSVNMGISALIDPNGRVLAPQRTETVGEARLWELDPGAADLPVSRWREFQNVPGVLIATIPIDHRVSLYARLGDWLPWVCWLVLGAGLILGFRASRRKTAATAN